MPLEIDAGHPAQIHVENQTERRTRRRRIDERLGGLEQRRFESARAEEASDCHTRWRVVFDDGDERWRLFVDHAARTNL